MLPGLVIQPTQATALSRSLLELEREWLAGKVAPFLGKVLGSLFGRGAGGEAAAQATARGFANETLALEELGLTRNIVKVFSPEGASIPDALTPELSVEIRVFLTKTAKGQFVLKPGSGSV
jgi:hypothetical protein